MKPFKTLFFAMLCAPAMALAAPPAIQVELAGIKDGDAIPEKYAFCAPDGAGKARPSDNINPEIHWSGVPKEAKSLVLLVVDKDVPAVFDDANQEGKTIANDFPRQDFYHWVLIDIVPDKTNIAEGAASSERLEKGKPLGKTEHGLAGQNDYATFMEGTFGGYDGPCPPWNDERMHHYHFQVYALDIPTLGMSGAFNGRQVMEKMKPHILAKGEVVGTFTNKK